ncbi:acetyltransferase [Allokutzneria sp. A3M-2-11 16]|uniref:GNAT family N-acetyltransferase n=1 Tax=Allokutzneria sp. A3M-2-11 16 TaxID=2962043 RepID=UPI0020B8B709|nr:GNAT family N-acetyltransferase [Allokutzneria sp. A3M-2-11 16]MCP3801264.1 acetyltransferase [Allokutzneria sp. A3M-2-11 16]
MIPVPALTGEWTLRLAAPEGDDLDLVHRWMHEPHVSRFWKQDWPKEKWREELASQLSGDRSRPCFLMKDGEPVMYVEIYRVVRDQLAAAYSALPGDVGLHLAIGDTKWTGRGVATTTMPLLAKALLDADEDCTRVVLEPDVRNVPAIRALRSGGFHHRGEITLPDKTAALLVYPRTEEDLP